MNVRRSQLVAPVLCAVVVAWLVLTPNHPPSDVFSITDSKLLGSQPGSAFVRDLYLAPHGAYWRAQGAQHLLVDEAEAICNVTGKTVADAFTSPTLVEVNEFTALARKDLCPVMARSGGTVPGYDGPP